MKVLAVGCHPDDLEIACSGTLRKYVEQGAEVYMCHVANGCLGHVIIEPEELRVIRTKEAEEAGFTNLKGHRSVGGMRASIYNAMPMEGVEKLVAFMEAFEKDNT